MVHVLCGFFTECRKTSIELSFLFENTRKTTCGFIVSYLLDGRPPSMFPLYVGVYTFHYTRSKIEGNQKNLLFPLPGIYLMLCPIYTIKLYGYETYINNICNLLRMKLSKTKWVIHDMPLLNLSSIFD